MPDGSGTTTTATTAAATTTTSAPWYQGVEGIDQETIGHWTNAGWINKKPEEIALQATKSWKAAEKHVGVPADQLLRLPKDAADETGWNALHQRLGKPKDAKEYDFSSVKFSSGEALDDSFTGVMRDLAFKQHLSKDAALAVTREVVKYMDNAESMETAEKTAKLAEEKTALKRNWGPNEAANKFVAERARQTLQVAMGIPDAKMALAIENMEKSLGYATVMEMFRTIGSKIGEDKFVSSTHTGANGVMTRDQAIAKKSDLMSDKAWVASYLAGDQAKMREMTALNTIITAQNA